MKTKLLSLVLAYLLCSCASHTKENATYWDKREVAGLTMILDHPVKYEWYSFNKDGSVAATYGEKNGWITSPLYFWKIKNGKLIIFAHDKKVFQTLALISQDSRTLKVKNKFDQTVLFTKQ